MTMKALIGWSTKIPISNCIKIYAKERNEYQWKFCGASNCLKIYHVSIALG